MERTSLDSQFLSSADLPPSGGGFDVLRRKKWIVVWVYLLLLFCFPILFLVLDELVADRVTTICGIGLSVFPFLWCNYDARQHGKRVDKLTGLLIILMSFLGVAVYFGRIRRRTFGECVSILFLYSLIFFGVYIAGALSFGYLYWLINPEAEIFQ